MFFVEQSRSTVWGPVIVMKKSGNKWECWISLHDGNSCVKWSERLRSIPGTMSRKSLYQYRQVDRRWTAEVLAPGAAYDYVNENDCEPCSVDLFVRWYWRNAGHSWSVFCRCFGFPVYIGSYGSSEGLMLYLTLFCALQTVRAHCVRCRIGVYKSVYLDAVGQFLGQQMNSFCWCALQSHVFGPLFFLECRPVCSLCCPCAVLPFKWSHQMGEFRTFDMIVILKANRFNL